jgi:lipopolysaccharide transport system ATP-binding protein
MAPAVRTVSLAKEYRLGQRGGARYDTRRDAVVRPFRSGARGARRQTIWALDDVTIEVEEGEVVGLIGRNGAGKTTLLKILSRITRPTRGRAEVRGRVGSLLEVGTGFHPELTGRENVFLNGAILGMRRAEITSKFDEIVAFAGVEQFIDTPVKRYSSGMHVRLAFAVAAHLEPEILLVDEVLAVGDAEFQRRSLGKMQNIGASGRTVFLVSHSMPSINRICERAVLLDAGRVVADGPASAVVAEYLKGEHGTSAERTWRDEEAPGNDQLRLRSLRVTDAEGATAPSVDVRERVAVELGFDVLADVQPFVPWLALFDEQGGHIFSAFDTDPRWNERVARGTYVARAWIPENLLNEGSVVVHGSLLSFASGGRSTVHASSGPAVVFQVVDPGEGDTARGSFVGPWTAPVRPLLEWSLERSP